MGIRKDKKDGRFIVSYTERDKENGKFINRTRKCFIDVDGLKQPIRTKSEATRVYRQLILEVKEALKRKLIPNWQVVLYEFEDYYHTTGVTKKTVENYMLCLRKHTSIWLEMGVEQISDIMIRQLINSLSSKSPSHRKNVLKFIRAVFNYAVSTDYILKNPTPNMKFKFKNRNLKYLTKTQVQNLLFLAKKYESIWFHHWLMALFTGMRSGELFALKWSHIDFDRRKIQVVSGWNSTDGFKDTKSGDERIVPISKDIVEELKKLKLQSSHGEFVLPRLSKWKKGEQARELRKFLFGIGLPEMRFHDLRAIWATNLLAAGVAPIKVMAMGGWADMKTMQKYFRKAGLDLDGATDDLGFLSKHIHSDKVLTSEKWSKLN